MRTTTVTAPIALVTRSSAKVAANPRRNVLVRSTLSIVREIAGASISPSRPAGGVELSAIRSLAPSRHFRPAVRRATPPSFQQLPLGLFADRR